MDCRIIQGNCLSVLKNQFTERVHTVITSPPYFHKRIYGSSSAEIGLESDVTQYCETLCDVFDAVNLHPLGSVWVNLADTRSHGGLLMVPQRFALAMKRRGWILIDNVVWAKVVNKVDGTTIGNCMPEPATNRLNGNGHESLF